MRTNVTRRTGAIAFISVAQSLNNEDMLFMSNPPVCELTEEQTRDLINMLTHQAEKKWGKSGTLENGEPSE